MKTISMYVLLIIFSVLFLIDLYAFRGLRLISSDLGVLYQNILKYIYWSVSIIIVLLLSYVFTKQNKIFSNEIYYDIVYRLMGLLITSLATKIVFIFFIAFSDILRLVAISIPDSGTLKLISLYITKAGGIVSCFILAAFVFGIAIGRFHYQINEISVYSPKIPKDIPQIRILQLSDWHIGSYHNHKKRIPKLIELINRQNPDMIVFTGDIVNNLASELEPFTHDLLQLKAPLGKYAILGNHDYGEYVRWGSEQEKEDNLIALKNLITKSGFQLLNNQSKEIKTGNFEINLVGVENWGLPPFPQFGNLTVAMENVDTNNFTLLLSHDPTHWSEEVAPNTTIDLTLSGHTHGMQFGIDIPWFKWSPVKWKYPLWRGLYKEHNQYLYVNKGIGFIGFPGRVGMRPEIAIFTLKNSL